MANEYRVKLQNAKIWLYGGYTFTFDAALSGCAGCVNVIYGSNGSGKTISLRALAQLLSLPLEPIDKVEYVERDGEFSFSGFDPDRVQSYLVRQNPIHNFDSGPIADNVRAFLYKNGKIEEQQLTRVIEEICGFLGVNSDALRAYPNNPAARKAMRPQAKCKKAM